MLDFQKAVGSFYIPPAISIGITYFAISKLTLFCFSYIGSHLKECSIAPHCSFVGNSFLEHLTCLCIHSWSYLYIIVIRAPSSEDAQSISSFSFGSVNFVVAEGEDSLIFQVMILYEIHSVRIFLHQVSCHFCSISFDTEILIQIKSTFSFTAYALELRYEKALLDPLL